MFDGLDATIEKKMREFQWREFIPFLNYVDTPNYHDKMF